MSNLSSTKNIINSLSFLNKNNPKPVHKKITPVKFSFENLVIGKHNEFAVLTCKNLIKNPGQFNPVLIQGPQGIGKTHIINAMVYEISKN